MAPTTEECLVSVPAPATTASQEQQQLQQAQENNSGKAQVNSLTQIVEANSQMTHVTYTLADLPAELANKLERQNSVESVGSMDDSGDQDSLSETSSIELVPRGERSDSVVSEDGSEEGGRDSGIEAEREPDMVLPDEDLMAKIVAQVEFYFSDANVAKDKFLLKHIRRNKEGYVSLKLVSSFKKVKQLTKDWRVVAFSLNKSSTKIQINDLGTKIRRVEPLPDLEEIPVTCAVLALAMPLEKPCIQSVSQLFSSCGDIAFIRVVRAGSALPQDLKPLATKYPALNDSHCAWIEFETPECAKLATELTNEDGMQVVPILPEAQKKPEKPTQERKNSQTNSRKNSVNNKENHYERKNSQSNSNNNSRKNSTASNRKNSRQEQYNYDTESPLQRQRRKAISLPITQRPNLSQLSAVVEERRSRPKSKSCTDAFPSGTSPPSTWVQRHLLAAAAASAASAAAPTNGTKLQRPSRVSQGSLQIPDGVVRFPKGPDGTKGFGSRVPKPVPEGVAVSS